MCSEPNIVIVADDDTDDSLFLLQVLLSLPQQLIVISVPNGEKLLSVLKSFCPQFIFLDINMPKKNGLDTLKQIRLNKELMQPRVIMCSTSSSPVEIKLSQELGADMFITKPSNINQLQKVISNIFETDWTAKAKVRPSEELDYSRRDVAV